MLLPTIPEGVAWSIFLWLVIAAVYGIGFIACGLPVPFGIGAIALVTVVAPRACTPRNVMHVCSA